MNSRLAEQKEITPAIVADSITYERYFSLIKELLQEGKTTGNNQSEQYVKYAKLNFQRMKRVYRTTQITEDFKDIISTISKKQIWIVLTEGWCGDAAQSLPGIAKVSELTENIDLRILLRDENPEIMNAYLTDGSKSIPKLISLDSETHAELFTWGPRPKELQKLVIDHIKNPHLSNAEFNEQLHMKYTIDKTNSLQKELADLIVALEKKKAIS